MHPSSSQGGQKGVLQQGNIWSEILMEFEESYAVFEARVSVQAGRCAGVLETATRGESTASKRRKTDGEEEVREVDEETWLI